jgi:ParB family transcriptional regulator, chromosome partitioning protein
MSNQPINNAGKAAPVPRPRATFAAATFSNLRAAVDQGKGEALRILLTDIDEDPDQPRTVFDGDELQSMAESIQAHGVVQPIVVGPPVNGRYQLVFGARRLRASKLAGVADIPAVIRARAAQDFAAQLIENQQRANLSNGDLAAAIARLSKEGLNNRQIGAICSLKDYQVAAFRQAANFPPELAERMNNGDMRALYDLFRQWGKTPAEVIAALPDAQTFVTVTEARRIIAGITGKPTGSLVLDHARAEALRASGQEAPAAAVAEAVEAPGVQPPHSLEIPTAVPAPVSTPQAAPLSETQPKAATLPELARAAGAGVPIFIVALADGQTGRLVVDQRARREGWALVAYATGIEEVDAAALRIVRIE